jgi:cytoskeletal protein RodZ
MSSPLIWLAAAAILIGLGLVVISFALSLAKTPREAAPAEPEKEQAPGQAERGPTFIDEPLEVDLASLLSERSTPASASESEAPAPESEAPAPESEAPGLPPKPDPGLDAPPNALEKPPTPTPEGEDDGAEQPARTVMELPFTLDETKTRAGEAPEEAETAAGSPAAGQAPERPATVGRADGQATGASRQEEDDPTEETEAPPELREEERARLEAEPRPRDRRRLFGRRREEGER